ncbi:UNVERIFIED_CONTAM: hypothetical protein RMT77_010747 [Armadillidium vulgare]
MGNHQTVDLKEELGDLKSLDLSKKLTPDEYLKHTRGIQLEGCLDSIPLDIIYYDTISMYEEVNLSFNYISYIPEEFSLRVPHLRHLNISHNQISGLPNSFHLLLHLRILNISFNKIENFPSSVVNLQKLHTLNISHNALKEIPPSISRLKKLKRLNISHNNLRALPESLLECSNLGIIVTNGNNLIHPPQAICDQGSSSTLEYLFQKRIHNQEKPVTLSPINGVFTRVRGQQVLASVSNPESASREYKQAQGTARSNKRKCPLMVPEHATTLDPDRLTETILGLVYGACIGDAFGLNVEGLSKDECLFYYDEGFCLKDRISDLLRSYFPPNDWSSNVDVMLLTLDSMMRWGGVVDELELVSQIIQWVVHGFAEIDPFPGHPMSPLFQQVVNAEGYVGHPHSVVEALHKRLKDEHNRGLNMNVNDSDNSCLPAAVILGIPHFYKENEVAMNAERICRATHSSGIAIASCIFTALVSSYLLQGKFHEDNVNVDVLLKEIEAKTLTYIQDDETKALFNTILNSNENLQPPSSDVALTLQFIVASLRKSKNQDFISILSTYFFTGGEGLSAHCCVVGGVLGAYFGYSKIPQKWLKQLPSENLSWLNTKLNYLLDLFGLP